MTAGEKCSAVAAGCYQSAAFHTVKIVSEKVC